MISDNFEILRDCRSQYLRQLASMLRDSLLLSANEITAVQQGAGEYFDEAVAAKASSSFIDEADGLTSSRITLVGEDDLEFGIRLDNFTARLLDASGSTLWRLHLRFITLLRRPDLPKGDNPVGPKGIARGLRAMFNVSGAITLDQKLDLLDKIEDWLLNNLPAVYDAVDAFLGTGGVEAAQTTIVTSPSAPVPPSHPVGGFTGGIAGGNVSADSINALVALQTALLARLPVATGSAPLAVAPGIQGGSGAPGNAGAAANLLSQAALDRVIHRLNDLDRSVDYQNPSQQFGGAPDNAELFPTLFQEGSIAEKPRPLNSTELGIPAHAPEGLAIDTLSLIFEAIFDDPSLPDGLKAVISSLQITMLKLAMRDASLFSDAAHPARQVIDKMARAMLGLPADTPARHPVCLKLFRIAGTLRSNFKGDIAAFHDASVQLDALIAERREEIVGAAKPFLALVQQLDRCDIAANQAQQAAKPAAHRAPVALKDFFGKSWPQVLQQLLEESGASSQVFQDHKKAIEMLLWSFEPKSTLEQRKELSQQLPFVLKTLKSGMEKIGLPRPEQQRILDVCFDLQTQALRGAQIAMTELVDDDAPPPAAAEKNDPVAGEIKHGGFTLFTFDFPNPVPPVSTPCQTGDWIAQGGENPPPPLMIAFISPDSRRHLLLNPLTGKAQAIHSVLISRLLHSGERTLPSQRSLFEQAANRALQRQSAADA